jgi:oligopeptide transport system substrate-binding protein
VDDGKPLTARAYTRRKFLAFTAAGTAAAALAACGSSSTAPTDTPAATKPAATSGPLPTATPVPQSLGVTAPAGSAASGTTAASSATTGTTGTAPAGSAVANAQPTTPANLADKQVLRYTDVEPPTFDPQVGSSPYNMPQMFVGLVEVDWTNNQIVPAAAQSYQANGDATQWTFKLRPNQKWSDGTPLTASAFVYAVQRIADPKVASKYTSAIENIKNGLEAAAGKVPPDQVGVSAPDDSTVVFNLTTPTPFFPLLASTWSYFPAPKHVIDKVGNDKWVEPGNIVGNGPYKMADWKHTQLQSFDINPNYFGPKPIITSVQCTIGPDDSYLQKGLAAYQNNELDTAQVAASDYALVQKDPTLSKQMKAFPGSSTYMLHWDATNAPTDKVEVRQALALGFDRQALIDVVLQKYYLDAPTILPPDIPGYNPGAALTGGVDKAKQLMAQAGFANGQGWPQDFKIVYASSATAKLVLEFLQSEWKKNLGINVNLEAMDSKAAVQYRVSRKDQPFNGLYGQWGSDYGDPFNWHNFLFSSKNEFWPTHWKNDEYETIIANAKGMTDNIARTKEYEKAEAILVQAANHLPLFHGQSFFLIKPGLNGIYHPAILGTVPRAKYAYWTKT